jgi:hypothetical protein
VNIHYVKSYSGSKAGMLLLQNGEKFSVARRKKAGLSKRLNKFNDFFGDYPVCRSSFSEKKNFAA